MYNAINDINDELSYAVLPSQYNDLIRRRKSGFDGEYRLMWAVLEDAIRAYLVNAKCSTQKQRAAFDEVCGWFFPVSTAAQGLFGFNTICDTLGIDSRQLLQGLTKLRVKDLPMRRYNRALRIAKVPRMAA